MIRRERERKSERFAKNTQRLFIISISPGFPLQSETRVAHCTHDICGVPWPLAFFIACSRSRARFLSCQVDVQRRLCADHPTHARTLARPAQVSAVAAAAVALHPKPECILPSFIGGFCCCCLDARSDCVCIFMHSRHDASARTLWVPWVWFFFVFVVCCCRDECINRRVKTIIYGALWPPRNINISM